MVFKYLGVYFDSKLSWNIYVSHTITKSLRRIHFMRSLAGTWWGLILSIFLRYIHPRWDRLFWVRCYSIFVSSYYTLCKIKATAMASHSHCCWLDEYNTYGLLRNGGRNSNLTLPYDHEYREILSSRLLFTKRSLLA